jgi:hypothetical protein
MVVTQKAELVHDPDEDLGYYRRRAACNINITKIKYTIHPKRRH